MKPDEDCCLNPYAENADYEISPIELIQDVSVLVLEGRLPEFSSNGRREGDHCWPVSLDSKKKCCLKSKYKDTSMCNFIQSARQKVRSIWTESIPAFIEVLVCLDNLFPIGPSNKEPCEIFLDYLPQIESQKILLLERWKMDVHQKDANASSSLVSINMFLQAVRSFLHFSQLSAWLIKTGGRIPSRIFYRILHGEPEGALEFNSPPEIHTFPQALTSRTESIRLTLFSLPRLELETLISMSPYKEFTIAKHLSRRMSTKSRDEGRSSESEDTPSSQFEKCSNMESRHCDVVYVTVPPMKAKFKTRQSLHDDVSVSLRKKLVFDTPEKKGLVHTSSNTSSSDYDVNCWNLIGQAQQQRLSSQANTLLQKENNCGSKKFETLNWRGNGNRTNGSDVGESGTDVSGKETKSANHAVCSNNGRKKLFLAGVDDDVENFSSKSYCSGRHCNGIGNHCNGIGNHCNGTGSHNNGIGSHQFNEFNNSSNGFQQEPTGSNLRKLSNGNLTSNDGQSSLSLSEQISNGVSDNSKNNAQSCDTEVTCKAVNHERSQSCKSLTKLESNERNQPLDRLRRSESYCGARPRPISLAAKLSLGACTVPVFHPKTGLPVASSPAPMRKPEISKTPEDHSAAKNSLSPSMEIRKARKFSSGDCIPQTKLFSRSAPASTRLLGNFEESVLKGRMPIFGTVGGFTADIGASGSFCPPHITCPVKAHFFRTSDNDAPSPYLGHIALRNAKGKKGYHVPRKGTVQLTLFNPHNTVVKVFFVVYDFSDMPSNSHTFLRQKSVSIRKDSDEVEEQQTLHYLVHLRFASTKHDRIYLHTDIRLIFPQQSPDVSSSKLKVLTNGPLEPKYTPRDR